MISPLATRTVPPRLAEALETEEGIRARLRSLVSCPTGDCEIDDFLAEQVELSEKRLEKLFARWGALCGDESCPGSSPVTDEQATSPVRALRTAFEVLSRGMIAYSALAPVANRVRDSVITSHEGMTSHAARDGIQECLIGMGRISGMIPAVVLRELVEEGIECQCTCPACGLGLCVCGNGMKAAISEAWMAARPAFEAAETQIPRPRLTSAAASAGFEEGDAVISIDGAWLKSYSQLQTAIKSHEMGEQIGFEVQRNGTSRRITAVRAADVGDGDLPLDCEAPSGEAFYLDRARDLQQRLRKRAGSDNGTTGLATLSTRETQVLRLLVDGATNPMIAAKLHIQRPTVARHVQNILVKLDVTNRSEAASIGAEAGLRSDL